MTKGLKIIILFLIIINFNNIIHAQENFFNEAKKKFDDKKLEDSKFLFYRDIVFNPKNAKSYLYLAKIFNLEENQKEEEKNLNTSLLLEPKNEEAMYMLMNIELKKSNFSEVKRLKKNFLLICLNLCEKIKIIQKSLENIEPKNES